MAREPEGVALDSAAGRWVVGVAVLGSGMAFLDSTVVNVALPAIGRDLDATTGALQWILNGYLLTLASLILLGGSLGDRYERRAPGGGPAPAGHRRRAADPGQPGHDRRQLPAR
jgi:MFS family permease